MSQLTLNRVVKAFLTTKREASELNPAAIDAWFSGVRDALASHVSDENHRWLARKGCQVYLPDKTVCQGVYAKPYLRCRSCESSAEVIASDLQEQALLPDPLPEPTHTTIQGIIGENNAV